MSDETNNDSNVKPSKAKAGRGEQTTSAAPNAAGRCAVYLIKLF